MHSKDKKKLRKNLIQFIFGLILLTFSYSYLQHHKAEAKSIWSGFDTLFEKATITREKVINNGDGELLEKKFKLEKYLEDVLGTVEKKNCLDRDTLERIKEIQELLSHSNTDMLKKHLDKYLQEMYNLDSLIRSSCK